MESIGRIADVTLWILMEGFSRFERTIWNCQFHWKRQQDILKGCPRRVVLECLECFVGNCTVQLSDRVIMTGLHSDENYINDKGWLNKFNKFIKFIKFNRVLWFMVIAHCRRLKFRLWVANGMDVHCFKLKLTAVIVARKRCCFSRRFVFLAKRTEFLRRRRLADIGPYR